MKKEEIEKIIRESDAQKDWIRNDEEGTSTYKNDVRLQIVKDGETRPFKGEDWAENHADRNATAQKYKINYCNVTVDVNTLVNVDGFRGLLPMPKTGTNEVDADEVQLARIANTLDTTDEYLARSGLVIINNLYGENKNGK